MISVDAKLERLKNEHRALSGRLAVLNRQRQSNDQADSMRIAREIKLVRKDLAFVMRQINALLGPDGGDAA